MPLQIIFDRYCPNLSTNDGASDSFTVVLTWISRIQNNIIMVLFDWLTRKTLFKVVRWKKVRGDVYIRYIHKNDSSTQHVPSWANTASSYCRWVMLYLVIYRFVLDNPQLFDNKRVLDVGSGCGASAIASKMSGARTVCANDIDPGKTKVQTSTS